MSHGRAEDITKPNPGRVYDYLLGGHHNFEADRKAGDALIKLLPFAPKSAKLQRWCLQDLAVELTRQRGYDVLIDFASGLPTQDHIHTQVPASTTVIYSDHDPLVVDYARNILGNLPNVHCFQGDARYPEELLNRPEVQTILHGRRDIGLIYWGVSLFISDSDLQHAMQALYQWGGPHSCVVFEAQVSSANANDPAAMQAIKLYEQMGSHMRIRSIEECQKLVTPWHADPKGWISLLQWHGFDESVMTAQDMLTFGPTGPGTGAYLIK